MTQKQWVNQPSLSHLYYDNDFNDDLGEWNDDDTSNTPIIISNDSDANDDMCHDLEDATDLSLTNHDPNLHENLFKITSLQLEEYQY